MTGYFVTAKPGINLKVRDIARIIKSLYIAAEWRYYFIIYIFLTLVRCPQDFANTS